jgi:hypothetical protein
MDPITISALIGGVTNVAGTLIPALRPRKEGQYDSVDPTIQRQSSSLIWLTVGVLVFIALVIFIIWRLTKKK